MAAAASINSSGRTQRANFDALFEVVKEKDQDELGDHWLIDGKPFNGIVIFLVVLNSIQIGVEADYPDISAWVVFEHFFTAAFLAEALIKIAVLGKVYFQHTFNCIDFFLVVIAVLDSWVLSLLFDGSNLQNFTVLRLVRIIRIARVFKIARQNKEIMLVATGIVEAMKSATWVSMVLVATIYVFAIFCVNTMGGENMKNFPGYTQDWEEINQTELMLGFNPYVRFGSMRNAMMTLFNLAIQAEFSDILWPLLLQQPNFVPVLLLFTLLVTYGMMNLIVGLVVENVLGNARSFEKEHGEREAKMKLDALNHITKTMRNIASRSATGDLTVSTMADVNCDDSQLLNKMIQAMGLPGYFTPVHLLELLDENGNGKLDEDELFEGTARLVEAVNMRDPFQHTCILMRSIHCLKAQLLQQHVDVEQAIQRGFEDLAAKLCRMTSDAKTLGEVSRAPERCHEELPSFADTVIRSQDEALKHVQDKLRAATMFVNLARETRSQYSAQKPRDLSTSGKSVLGKHPLVVRHMADIEVLWQEDQLLCSTSCQAYVVKPDTQQHMAQELAPEGESGCRYATGPVLAKQLDGLEETMPLVRMKL